MERPNAFKGEGNMDANIEKILKIMKIRFNLDFLESWETVQYEQLLGFKIGLRANDLLYLYFDIEEEFGIRIPEEYIIGGKFSTLNNILEMIQNELDRNVIENV